MLTLAHRCHDPEEKCIFRVDKVTAEDDVLLWLFTVERGKRQGSRMNLTTPLAPDDLWKLRELLVGLGVEILNGPMELKPNALVGLRTGGFIRDGDDWFDFWPLECEEALTALLVEKKFKSQTQQAIDKARADLDRAIEAYARARAAEFEDIERHRWRARSMAR
jgi:hypothetical protein